MIYSVLRQLLTEDNSPPDKHKAQLMPTRTTIPRTTPHYDNSPTDQYSKTTHQDQYLHGGELSWWGDIRYGYTPIFCVKMFLKKRGKKKVGSCPDTDILLYSVWKCIIKKIYKKKVGSCVDTDTVYAIYFAGVLFSRILRVGCYSRI